METRRIGNCVLFFLLPISILGQSFSNQSFNDSIKSVFFSQTSLNNSIQYNQNLDQLPVINLGQSNVLQLHFDYLSENYQDLSYTFVHCNPDWTPSELFANEYLEGYTEDNILDFQFSQNTTQNYIHYSQTFPDDNMKITRSGN